jgi:hypothetical protein
MTLDEFITDPHVRNQWVAEPGFAGLYVRKGARYVLHERYENVLDIADVETEEKGKGTFKRLIERLRTTYPTMHLYVENVLFIRFGEGLERMGFQRLPVDDGHGPYSFFLRAKE